MSSEAPKKKKKKSSADFDFGALLGEGSYAKVLLCRLVETKQEYAAKIVDKSHVKRFNKVAETLNEKTVLSMLKNPLVVQLKWTFQDEYSLYYILELAPRGELFRLIKDNGALPVPHVKYYGAQMVAFLEYLHGKNVVHRDFKPENILLTETGRIKVTDFATSKILRKQDQDEDRRKSFVGTAEYVSPELLNDEAASFAADMWALGCIMYQMLVGRPPFRGESEYLTFQKIVNRELEWPDTVMDEEAKDVTEKLLTLDAGKRLGASPELMTELKGHPLFKGIDWAGIATQDPPQDPSIQMPVSVSMDTTGGVSADPNLNDEDSDEEDFKSTHPVPVGPLLHKTESQQQLADKTDELWQKFLIPDEHILFRGLVRKRRGLFAKKRQLILTDFPRFFYVDPVTMVQKGEIQWTDQLKFEKKNQDAFYINTPKRSLYIQGISCGADPWLDAIHKVIQQQKNKPT